MCLLVLAWHAHPRFLGYLHGQRERLLGFGKSSRMPKRPELIEAYERDRAEARTAAGSPTELQGKSAQTDGPVRYTAPSLIVEKDGLRLEAGGFQPTGAYDVVVANVDPTLTRHEPPEGPLPLLERYREGLSTQEVATLLTHGLATAAAWGGLLLLEGGGSLAGGKSAETLTPPGTKGAHAASRSDRARV